MNLNYKRSRNRENLVRKQLEKDGWYAVRAAGSKGNADVVAIKSVGNNFKVRFIQIKVSEKLRKAKKLIKFEDAPFGKIKVEYWKFPVKTKKWYARTKHK